MSEQKVNNEWNLCINVFGFVPGLETYDIAQQVHSPLRHLIYHKNISEVNHTSYIDLFTKNRKITKIQVIPEFCFACQSHGHIQTDNDSHYSYIYFFNTALATGPLAEKE